MAMRALYLFLNGKNHDSCFIAIQITGASGAKIALQLEISGANSSCTVHFICLSFLGFVLAFTCSTYILQLYQSHSFRKLHGMRGEEMCFSGFPEPHGSLLEVH
jgi:hypothetical protein